MFRPRPPLSLVPLVLLAVAGCCASRPVGATAPTADAAPPMTVGHTVEADHGVVVSVCPIASRVGCDVLRQGGNAVDAAVATALALAVTWPEAGNVGGGGFMMVCRPTLPAAGGGGGGSVLADFVDYRETAPAAVRADSFANAPSQHLLAGTPGTVRGLHLAYERFGSGTTAWKNLVLPAVKLAAEGFEIDAALATSLNSGLKGADAFAEFRRVYGKPDGSAWTAGDRLTLPDLAGTLGRIAEQGPAGFYEGETARLVVDEMRAGGGLVSADDLRGYQVKLRHPIVGSYGKYTIYAPPPPSSGGVALLQMLNMMEVLDPKPADRWAAATAHVLVESMRRAFADRARHLGDPDFTDVPVEELVGKERAKEMAGPIDRSRASKSEDVAKWAPLADGGGQTTHFSVVDRAGTAVSNTYTLEQSFGGRVVVRGAGFLLNNELGDFNPRPGFTTRAGQVGTPPNVAAGGKRPLSSMTPTIVADGGKVTLVTGSPGGRTIINTVAQVVLNRLAFGMTLRDAVDAPRLHHQWFPDGVRVESAFAKQHPETLQALIKLGHRIDPRTADRQGDAHSIAIDPSTGRKTGVADRRIGGAAAGY